MKLETWRMNERQTQPNSMRRAARSQDCNWRGQLQSDEKSVFALEKKKAKAIVINSALKSRIFATWKLLDIPSTLFSTGQGNYMWSQYKLNLHIPLNCTNCIILVRLFHRNALCTFQFDIFKYDSFMQNIGFSWH